MGWLITLLLATQIALQYLVRPWRRLWLHKVLAFAIFIGATWHTMGAMHPGLRVGHASGLYIASLAWTLLAFQILVGFALERTSRHGGSLNPADSTTEQAGASRLCAFTERRASNASGLRKLHTAIMIVVVCAITAHLFLNAS